MTDIEKWMFEAPAWKEELERCLLARAAPDRLVGYYDVARAFPRNAPNPNSFDLPLIDFDILREWARSAGWDIELRPDAAPHDQRNRPGLFFRKIG